MPKIKLKDNSPEYSDENSKQKPVQRCESPGCMEEGVHRAPKFRSPNESYFFCLKHAKDYNTSWNFFDGMSQAQVKEEMLKSLYGDRPTWKQSHTHSTEDLKRKAWQTYTFEDDSFNAGAQDKDNERKRRANAFAYHHDSPEYESLALLGLEPPLNMDMLKKRYKDLAKKHHPDRNGGCEKAEEQLKRINIAYATLKGAFEKYEKLMDND